MSTDELGMEQLPGATGVELVRQIDALSLSQALVDFEMANARVLDLTARLVEANERVVRFGRQAADASEAARADRAMLADAQSTVAVLTGEIDALREVIAARDRDALMLHGEIAARDEVIRVRTNEVAALRSSRAYRLGSRIGSLTRVFR